MAIWVVLVAGAAVGAHWQIRSQSGEPRIEIEDLLEEPRHGAFEAPPDDEGHRDELALDGDGLDDHENIPAKAEKKPPFDGLAARLTATSMSMTRPIPSESR